MNRCIQFFIVVLIILSGTAAFCNQKDQKESVRTDFTTRGHDSWFGEDKGKHFFASAILTGGGWHISRYYWNQPCRISRIIGISFSFSLGFAKEFNDYRSGRIFSLKDMAANILGILFGVFLLTW